MDPRELLAQRATLIKEARTLVEKAETEKRALTAEEETRYTKILADANDLKSKVDREDNLRKLERELETTDRQIPGPDPDDQRRSLDPKKRGELEQRALKTWDDAGRSRELMAPEEVTALVGLQTRAFRHYVAEGLTHLSQDERRALQADNQSAGGALVPPQEFVGELIKFVDDQVFIRQWARKFQVAKAASMGAASLDSDPADADWTTELGTGQEDAAMAFGRRELVPHPIGKRIKVSNKLLRTSSLPVEGLVRERLGYKIGITHEKAFMTGSGANRPLGVFTASSQGISTGRDVSNGNTTTSIQFDGLISAKYFLKGPYHPRARWLFHRDGVAQIAKLKDSEGQYIWRESVRVGEPDRLLGLPIFMSEYAPNTFTTGLYVGILGDFNQYWIVDALDMTIQRLVELYAEANQTGFIARMESDGMPVLEEAFVRVKLA